MPAQPTSLAPADRTPSRHHHVEVNPLSHVDPDLYANHDDIAPALDTSCPSIVLSIGLYYQAVLTASEQWQRL